jgi:signal transduction histidine kinase
VGCKKENNIILVAISDTGCGIEEENLENVFKEFFRVDNSINKEAKGTGLGLSLVKKIIETHKEKIWAESKVGKGTTFYFTLKSGKNA